MMIHDITARAGRYRARKRVGRGPGSGHGKTSGRGHKGHGSRTGFSRRHQFEGGQMPMFRRLPKFGFSNARFRTRYWTVNLDAIVAHPLFRSGGRVDADSLIQAGLIRDRSRGVKVLGRLAPGAQSISARLEVIAERVSASARRLIEQAGGTVRETAARPARRRTRRAAGAASRPAAPSPTQDKS